MTFGGVQRWILALRDTLRTAGRGVVVHQRSAVPFERHLDPFTTVIGHRASTRAWSGPRFNRAAHKRIPKRAPVVYMAEDNAYPICRPDSVVVQHGIWWDGEYGWAKARLAEHLARHAVRRSGRVLCVDTNFINWYRARWPDDGQDEKLHYVPNFVDPEQFGPAPIDPVAIGSGDRPLTVCFPRRSEPRRGIWLMQAVAPQLHARFPNLRFRFVVGSGYHTEQLRRGLQSGTLPESQYSIETLPFDAMRQAYETSEIVVIPTVCGEGTSLSAIEAMHFGCAIVSTWVGGLPNLIQHERNGLLIPPTKTALRDALTRLIQSKPLRERLGRAALADAATCFQFDNWQRAIAPVLTELLAKHSATA